MPSVAFQTRTAARVAPATKRPSGLSATATIGASPAPGGLARAASRGAPVARSASRATPSSPPLATIPSAAFSASARTAPRCATEPGALDGATAPSRFAVSPMSSSPSARPSATPFVAASTPSAVTSRSAARAGEGLGSLGNDQTRKRRPLAVTSRPPSGDSRARGAPPAPPVSTLASRAPEATARTMTSPAAAGYASREPSAERLTPAFARGRLRIDAPGADLARAVDREQRRAVGERKNRDNAAPGREARELGPAARVEHAQRASRVEQREVAAARAEPPALDVA